MVGMKRMKPFQLPMNNVKIEVKDMKFNVTIEGDEVGGYVVSCPTLVGCHSQGDTVDEALKNIEEAIQACLESLSEDAEKEATFKPSSKVVEVVV